MHHNQIQSVKVAYGNIHKEAILTRLFGPVRRKWLGHETSVKPEFTPILIVPSGAPQEEEDNTKSKGVVRGCKLMGGRSIALRTEVRKIKDNFSFMRQHGWMRSLFRLPSSQKRDQFLFFRARCLLWAAKPFSGLRPFLYYSSPVTEMKRPERVQMF